MALYEHVFMLRQDVSATQAENLTKQFKSVLEDNGGKVERTEYWGLKPLAYKIRKNRKAHFTMVNIDAPAAAVKEMERQMSLNDDVIRFLTLRVDEHESEPSVMMRQSRSRDDRGPRGPRRSPPPARGGQREAEADDGAQEAASDDNASKETE